MNEEDALVCPRCGEKGKPVSLATVGAMAETEVEAVKLSAQEYKLCRSRDCSVVYYAEKVQLEKKDLRVLATAADVEALLSEVCSPSRPAQRIFASRIFGSNRQRHLVPWEVRIL